MPRISQRKVVRVGTVVGGSMLLLQNALGASHSLTFGWAANSEPNIAGYNLYYGVASRTYNQVLDVGNTTTATLTNLSEGTTYYFALAAYNTLGLESDLTPELSYSVPSTLAPLQIRVVPPRQTVLTISGPAGHTYSIQASADLKGWTTIGSVTIGATGSATFTENNPQNRSKRFYRATATQP